MAAPSDTDDLLADCPTEEREEERLMNAINRECLPTLSDTRWLSRFDSISTLLVNYSRIYDAVSEVMMQSTGKASHDASSYLHAMEQFHFIVSAVLTQYILGYTRPLSVLLRWQSKLCDLLKAHREPRSLVSILNRLRQSEETFEGTVRKGHHSSSCNRCVAFKTQNHRQTGPSRQRTCRIN